MTSLFRISAGLSAFVFLGCLADDTTFDRSEYEVGDQAFLAFMNDEVNTTFERLDDDCRIRSDSARNLVERRANAPFQTVQDVDDVRMVGPWTMGRLFDCAELYAPTPELTGDWEVVLDADGGSPSQIGVAAHADGGAAMLYRDIVFDPNGNAVVSVFRNFEDGVWGDPAIVSDGFPLYPESTYGPTVKGVFDHDLVAIPASAGSDVRYVAAVLGRYSTSQLNSQGLLYAIFLRAFDGDGWGDWYRVTEVGTVGNMAVAADADGDVWFSYSTGNNLAVGEIFLGRFDLDTEDVWQADIVDDTSTSLAFNQINVVPAPAGDVWVTYETVGGQYARRLDASGVWDPRLTVFSQAYTSGHHSAWADDTLWVAAARGGGIEVHRLDGAAFVPDATPLVGYENETEVDITALNYSSPLIAPRFGGGVTVVASRDEYYENFDTGDDGEQRDTAAADLGARGV
jgi:hypothetical protein